MTNYYSGIIEREINDDEHGPVYHSNNPLPVRALDTKDAREKIIDMYKQNETRWIPSRTSAQHPHDTIGVIELNEITEAEFAELQSEE